MTQRQPTITNPTEGRTIAVVGDVYRLLAISDDTHGTYAMCEVIVTPAACRLPPHTAPASLLLRPLLT
jgi:hypothetical protein